MRMVGFGRLAVGLALGSGFFALAQDGPTRPEPGVSRWRDAASAYRITLDSGRLTSPQVPLEALHGPEPALRALTLDRPRSEPMSRSRHPRRRWTLAVLLLTLAGGRPAAAQDEKAAEGPSSWLPILKQQAAEYEIVPRGGSKKVLKPLPEPILRWTQPVRGGDDGAVFLWVLDGRPEVVGTIFTWRGGGPRVMQHEVHSLAPTGLDATWRGKPMWHPDRPGLAFKPVPEAPAPATSAPARLRQMQAVAREFSASSVHEKTGRNELRLMPRALYRYKPTDPGLIDGTLFCFAHGTDPELFLLVEARRDGNMAEYRHAFARFSDLELHARHKGHDVWDAPRGSMNDRSLIHAYYVVEELDAETPEDYRRVSKGR